MSKRLQIFSILIVAAGLAVPVLAGPSAPVGIVTGAQHAVIGHLAAVDGTSIFDGDTIATEAAGAMRLRFGSSQMVLNGNTEVTLHKTDTGVSATLVRGNVRFLSAPGSILEVRTLKNVVIRPKGNEPATGQLSLIGPNVFEVGSTKGALDVSVNGVDHEVDEAKAYRVDVDSAPDPSGGAGQNSTLGAGTSGGVWVAVGLIAAGTTAAIIIACMSPSAP